MHRKEVEEKKLGKKLTRSWDKKLGGQEVGGQEVGDGPSYLSDYYAIRIEICLSFALTTTFLSGKNNT